MDEKPDSVYIQKCACCGDQISISFTPFPADQPKTYCTHCARFIMQFSEKFGVKRFEKYAVVNYYGGDRQGAMIYHTRLAFFNSDLYENNQHQPNVSAFLEKPLQSD